MTAPADPSSTAAPTTEAATVGDLARSGEYFAGLLSAMSVAIYATDVTGTLTYYNDAAAALWGGRPHLNETEWRGSWQLLGPDGTPIPYELSPMARTIEEGRPTRGGEIIAERPDGSTVHLLPFPTPLFDAGGVLVGGVNVLVDVTDRKRADDAAHRSAAIVESSDDGIIAMDSDATITTWNEGAERLFGYAPQEVVGKSVRILIPMDRHDEAPAILDRIRAGERVEHYETIRRRKDGRLVEISLTVSPIKNSSGAIVWASKISRDITERKRAQEQQGLLFDEMKHRVRNTLATVQAIATQSLRSSSEEERSAFVARLHSLANAHDLLTLESWNRVTLEALVTRATSAFQEKSRQRIFLDGAGEVWLDANRSLLLAMVFHELGTNALKYGALSCESGRVDVKWDARDETAERSVKILWRESGGPPVQKPARDGFGSFLIVRALSGLGKMSLEFDPNGVCCTMEISL